MAKLFETVQNSRGNEMLDSEEEKAAFLHCRSYGCSANTITGINGGLRGIGQKDALWASASEASEKP